MPLPRKPRILAVEDNADLQLLLRYMVQGPYDIDFATSYDEGYQRAQDRPYDLLLLDINLGEARTGTDLLNALRTLPAYQNVPAIAYTAYDALAMRGKLSALGFDGYVQKPCTRQSLLDVLERLLALGSSHDALLRHRPRPVVTLRDAVARMLPRLPAWRTTLAAR